MTDEGIRYLISLDFHGNWGFPKGHIEEGESEEEAALREIREEVGIAAMLNTEFREELIYPLSSGKIKHSIYFLGCFRDQIPKNQPEEVQESMIVSYEQAMERLTFDSMKEVLAKANEYLLKEDI